jgi:hypothetical protein
MIPVKPRSAQVIDLTDDSDGDEEEDSEDDEDEEEIELLGATNVILARHTGKGPIPATRTNGRCRDLLARAEKEYLHRPLQAIDSIAGSSKRSAIDDTYVGDGPTRVSKFWKPRDGPATPQSSTASDSTMTMSDESTPSARSISITLTPTPEIVQVKYKGPILTEISTKAIWSHLDNGWKHVKRNKTALRSLATWWAWTPVNKAHKLGKQENWLLAYATFKWWEALEERWRTVLSETLARELCAGRNDDEGDQAKEGGQGGHSSHAVRGNQKGRQCRVQAVRCAGRCQEGLGRRRGCQGKHYAVRSAAAKIGRNTRCDQRPERRRYCETIRGEVR